MRKYMVQNTSYRLSTHNLGHCRTISTLGRPIYRLVSLFTSPNTLLAEHDRRCDPDEEEEDLSNVDIEALNPFQLQEYEKRIEGKRVSVQCSNFSI